jgi:hypothetical protein
VQHTPAAGARLRGAPAILSGRTDAERGAIAPLCALIGSVTSGGIVPKKIVFDQNGARVVDGSGHLGVGDSAAFKAAGVEDAQTDFNGSLPIIQIVTRTTR